MVIVCMGHGYDISVDFGHLIANVRVVRVGDNRRSRAFFKFERGMAEPSDFILYSFVRLIRRGEQRAL